MIRRIVHLALATYHEALTARPVIVRCRMNKLVVVSASLDGQSLLAVFKDNAIVRKP